MKQTYKRKNVEMNFELNKPTKWYQWLTIALMGILLIWVVIK